MKKLNHFLVIFLLCIAALSYGLCFGFSKNSIFVSAPPEQQVKLPVIMYHLVLNDKSRISKFIITPEMFENDLNYLLENGYTPIDFHELESYVSNGAPLPPKPVMITFDDGYYNNYKYVYPILQKNNAKIVLSVIGKQAQKYTEIDDTNPNYAHCSWDILKEMSDSGLVEVENHSFDLHTYNASRKGAAKNPGESSESYKKMLYSDLVNNHKMIESNVGKAPVLFTFPFGNVSSDAHTVVRDIGYKGSLSCSEGINYISRNPNDLYMLKRYNRSGKISTEEFFASILND